MSEQQLSDTAAASAPAPEPSAPAAESSAGAAESSSGGGASGVVVKVIIGFIVFIVVSFLLAFVLAFFDPGAASGVALIRDFFIIMLMLEGIVVGAALIILVLQLARLINLLQNEVKPILEQTNDTVQTVKGTATFMSKNVADPVIRAGGALAWLRAVLAEVLGIVRAVR